MKTQLTKALAIVATAAIFTACKKDNPSNVTRGEYIVTVTPVASTGVADYLINVPSLDNGSTSTFGNGLEQDGTYRYYLTHKGKFFSMLYGQGNPGAVTAYNNANGRLNKLTNFQTETVQAFAAVNDDILLTKVPRTINTAGSTLYTYYQVSTNSLQITKEGTLDALAPANNGEIAHFSWLQQVGNKVYAPFFPIKNGSFDSDFHDQAWIAVYSYPEMQLEKTIHDDRTSFIGRYFTNGLGVVENGDIYAFSTSVATTSDKVGDKNVKRFTDTQPSAITRIKSGTEAFDSYYLDFEQASNGYVITNWIYVGNNKFIANIQPKAEKGAYTTGKELAVLDVAAKTVNKISGLPALGEIKSLTSSNYTPKDGNTAYIGVNLTSGIGYVYKIDASAKTATQGLKVEGGTITAVQYLKNN